MNLIAAQSLLKAASDLAPSRSATDSGSVEGKRVGVSWRWAMLVHGVAGVSSWGTWLEGEPYYGTLAQHSTERFIHTNPQWNTSHSGSDLH